MAGEVAGGGGEVKGDGGDLVSGTPLERKRRKCVMQLPATQ